MRPSPSLHSLSVYCCRDVVTDRAALTFPLLPGCRVGLEQPWGWSCRGAGSSPSAVRECGVFH